jgi:glycosyltransferase involved in cell wall biosynthesis
MIESPRALVLSPTTTHPQDLGNRNRVWQLTSFLKTSGYAVDFVLYPVEGEWIEFIPPDAAEVRNAWDMFWVIPPSEGHAYHGLAAGDHHYIDDWWDDSIGHFLKWLFDHRRYDVMVVNYTFLSRAFTFAPSSTLKLLETHDLFSGRREMLEALGAGPEFFYTTRDQETIAFDRADLVIAIKASEAALIRRMTTSGVISLPFFPSGEDVIEDARTKFPGLSVGFLGGWNSVNSRNLQAFLDELAPLVRLYCPPLQFIIAGQVCDLIRCDLPVVKTIGRVDSLAEFYSQVDVVVAPMVHSTGIKIKVGEALRYGKGVVATANGFDGYSPTDPYHTLVNLKDVARALIELAYDSERRDRLIERSRLSARLAREATAASFRALSLACRKRLRRIAFVTDIPYWTRRGPRADRLGQWSQLCGNLARCIDLYLDPMSNGAPANIFSQRSDVLPYDTQRVDTVLYDVSGVRSSDGVDALADKLDEQLRQFGQPEIMLSVEAPWAAELCLALIARGHAPTIDLHAAPLAAMAMREGLPTEPDLWMVDDRGVPTLTRGETLDTTFMRYASLDLLRWLELPVGRGVVAITDGADTLGFSEELRLAVADEAIPVEIVAPRDGDDELVALYSCLQAKQKPRLLLTIAPSMALKRAANFLGLIGGVPFIAIDRDSFPYAICGRGGGMSLCHSISELIEAILQSPDSRVGPTDIRHALDTGWSGLWRRLEERWRRSHQNLDGSSPRIDPPSAASDLEDVVSLTAFDR